MDKRYIFRFSLFVVWIFSFIFFVRSILMDKFFGIFLFIFISFLLIIFELYFKIQRGIESKYVEFKSFLSSELNKQSYENQFKFQYLQSLISKKSIRGKKV